MQIKNATYFSHFCKIFDTLKKKMNIGIWCITTVLVCVHHSKRFHTFHPFFIFKYPYIDEVKRQVYICIKQNN